LTNWIQFNKNSVYVDVDTSVCGFVVKPNYVTALGGAESSAHWRSKGSSEIWRPSATGFYIYINLDDVTPSYAAEQKWHVNWIGQHDGKDTSPEAPATGPCAGHTGKGTTRWINTLRSGEPTPGTTVTTVDTSACGFTSVPVYLSSLLAAPQTAEAYHDLTTGSSEVYRAKADEFMIFVEIGGSNATGIATSNKYHINWIGHPQGKTINSGGGVTCAGITANTEWRQHKFDGLYVDIDTSVCGFTSTPIYVTSMGGEDRMSDTTGGSEIYKSTENSLRVYISRPGKETNPTMATQRDWHINWMGMLETSMASLGVSDSRGH